MTLSIVILAAGKGSRMHSSLPKVLHRIGGIPLLEHVARTTHKLNPAHPAFVVYGYQGDIIRQQLAHLPVLWVEQVTQQGTAHAVLQTLPHIPDEHSVLVLNGDVPLITHETLKKFIAATPAHTIGLITMYAQNPAGLGRIIRQDKQVIAIVEDKEASTAQRAINEVNTGIYLIPAGFLKKWLPQLTTHNSQQEYYLTDIIACAVTEAIPINAYCLADQHEALGINDRQQLAIVERYYQQQLANQFMLQGVTLMDPARFDVRGELKVGRDVTIDINVIFEGNVTLSDGCSIGAHSIIRNSTLGEGVIVKAFSHIDSAVIEHQSTIGPFARIRPGSILKANTVIGNFVEIKNSTIGDNSKINHLSYIGDCEMGQYVNVGAGTITCNFDGANKHKTMIGDNAFIGSGSQLIAPLSIGEYATIGAGSTITRDTPAHQLTLCRTPQRVIEQWRRPQKKES